MFLLVTLLLVLTVGLTAGFFMMWSKLSALDTVGNTAVAAQNGQAQSASLGPLFSLDTFIVNLADATRSRYLRVTMDLELTTAADAAKITKKLPQIRDSILMILPGKQFDDIASMEGKIALRDEIIAKLNSLFARTVVTNIFFTEFVVQ
jgi:flagellar FliL protein